MAMTVTAMLLFVPPIEVSAAAQKGLNTDVNSVSGSEFTNFDDLAKKLDSIFAGNVGLYSNGSLTKPVTAKLGTRAVSPGTLLWWNCNSTICNGYECYAYAISAYCLLYDGTNPDIGLNSNHQKIAAASGNTISYNNFVNWGVRDDLPVFIQIGSTSDGTGHSIIVLTYTKDYITYLDGNGDGNGLIAIRKEPWVNKFDSYTGANIYARKISYIVQPKDSYYPTHKCTTFEGLGVCKECGKTFNWEKTLDKTVAGTYKVTNNFTPRTNAPYSDATKASTTIKKGETVEVVGVYTNAFGSKFYKFTYNSGKSTGYVYESYLTFSSHTHSYGSTYSNDTNGHWKICSTCGGKSTVSTHSYSNACDTSCNTCGYTRTITHTYSNNCDTSCNVCSATRTITHTYSNSCDTTCNVCSATRTVTHTYTDDCDATCNTCGYTRTVNHEFAYKNDASGGWQPTTYHWEECVKCGEKKESEKHTWKLADIPMSTVHIFTCTVCNVLVMEDHVYSNDCDTLCNVCNHAFSEREPSHTYSNSCDASCNVCGETRTITHTYDAYDYDFHNHWKVCSVCGDTDETTEAHSISSVYYYKKNNELSVTYHFTDCTVCGGELGYRHKYTNDCDESCNDCIYTRKTNHTYDNDCDTDCNVCGETRHTEHTYDAYEYDYNNHWKVCSCCGEIGGDPETHSLSSVYYFFVYGLSETYHFVDCTVCGSHLTYRHTYTNDCDTTCNDCGEYIRRTEHTYDGSCDTNCNVCGETRTTDTQHTYDNDCDIDCNICGEIRSTQHVYGDEEDTTCNICGESKAIETLPSASPELEPDMESTTKPVTDPNTDSQMPSQSNKEDANGDEDDGSMDKTTVIIIAVAAMIAVASASAFGTFFAMKKKR